MQMAGYRTPAYRLNWMLANHRKRYEVLRAQVAAG